MHPNPDFVGIHGVHRPQMYKAGRSCILVSVGQNYELGRDRIRLRQVQLPGGTPGVVGLGKVVTDQHVGNNTGEGIQIPQV